MILLKSFVFTIKARLRSKFHQKNRVSEKTEHGEWFDLKVFDNQDQNMFDKNKKYFEQKKEQVRLFTRTEGITD